MNILITGSSRGIGAATARLAKERGFEPILHGRTESDELLSLAGLLNADYIFCDVNDSEAVKTAVSGLIERVGVIYALINCAGIHPKFVPFIESTDKDWEDIFKTNLLGVIHFCQAVIPHILERGHGRIVNVSSTRGFPQMANQWNYVYAAAKAALNSVTVEMAKEFAPNILVNAISPGYVATERTEKWNEITWQKAKSVPLGRPIESREVAGAILFLATTTAMTGANLVIDGGQTVHEQKF